MPSGIPKNGINKGWFIKGISRPRTPQQTINQANATRGKKRTIEQRIRIALGHKGLKRSLETRIKMGNSHRGEKNVNWKGGISKITKPERLLFMETIEYSEWRKAVFTRDNWICQMCGARGVKIHADHIKRYSEFPELRLDINNGRTLCIPCHKTTDSWGRPKKYAQKVT